MQNKIAADSILDKKRMLISGTKWSVGTWNSTETFIFIGLNTIYGAY